MRLIYTEDMPQYNLAELEYSAYAEQTGLSGISLPEQKVTFYNAQNGTTYANWVDAEVHYLRTQTGATTSNLQELWKIFLVSKGIPDMGSLTEMLYQFFLGVGFTTASSEYLWELSNADLLVWHTGDNASLIST